MIRLVMMSGANTVTFPMQDILGLGAHARMNRPATQNGKWQWRLNPRQLSPALITRLSQMVKTYARD